MARTPVTNAAFTAADGTHPAGFTDLSNGFGQVQVIGNKFHCGFGFPADSRDNDTFATGQYAEVVLSGFSGSGNTDEVGVGLLFSADTQPNRDGYRIYIRDGATVSLIVEKVVNDAITVLRTDTSVGWTAGDVLSAEADPSGGSSTVLKLFKNDVQVGTDLTDSSTPHTTGKPGLYAKGGASDTLRGDDYEAGDGFLGGGTSPSVSSTSTATPANGSALTLTGTNFGATQGAGSVTIGGISQTVTSWADTSIVVTVARGTNKYGVAVNVVVTDNALVPSAPYALTSIQPQSGWAFVNLTTPDPVISRRLQTSPDLDSGDQIAYDTKSGGVTVAADATFTAANTVTRFQFEAWTPAGGWGAQGEQIIYPQWFAPASADSYELAAKVAQFQSLLNPQTWFGPIAVEKWFADELAFTASGPGEIIGTLNSTLGAVTASAAGSASVNGTLSRTLNAVTTSAAGSVAVAGSLAVTLGAVTTSAAGSASITGTLNSTLGAVTLTSAASAGVNGTLSATLGAVTLTGSGTVGSVGANGDLAVTLGAVTSSAAGSASVNGTLNRTLGAVTTSAAGSASITGTLSGTLGAVTLTGAGVSGNTATGNLSSTLGAVTTSAAGSAAITGTLNRTLGAVSITGAGSIAVTGVMNVTLGSLGLSASGQFNPGVDNRIFLTISESLIVQHLISDAAQVDLRISD
jgi:hypothetical protein